MKEKGIFEFEVGEPKRKRGFKFGTFGLGEACDLENCSLDVLFKRIGIPYPKGKKDEKGNDILESDPVNLKSLLHLFYGTAVHYAHHCKQEVDFSVSDVSDWIDEIGLDKLQAIFLDGLTQYTPKNLNSLAKTGEKSVTQ